MRSAALTSTLHLAAGVHDQTAKTLKDNRPRSRLHAASTIALSGVLSCLVHAAIAQTLTSVLPVDQMPTEMTGSSRQPAPMSRIEVPLSENAWDFNRSHDIPGFGPMTAQQSEEVLRSMSR